MQPLFEAWSVSTPLIPARSELYSLEPIGAGTAFVESLTGYVARLAEVHSLKVGDLVGRLLSPLPNPYGAIITPSAKAARIGGHGFRACGYVINGVSERAMRWSHALELATDRRDLHCLTLLPFRNVLSDQLFFRRRRAWCAVCFEQWRLSGQIVYEPLLWAIEVSSYCPVHLRALDCACPHCERTLSPLAVFSRPGYCERCGYWLGMSDANRYRSHPGHPNGEAKGWSSRQVGELLAMLPKLDAGAARESLRLNLVAYLEHVAGGNILAMAEYIQCPRSTLQSWLDGAALPRLDSLLRICRSLSISASSLFTHSYPTPMNIAAAKNAVALLGNRGASPSRHASEIRRALLLALREEEPLSLSEVARKLGYTTPDRLYQADRKLCHKIAARYRRSGRSHWWRKAGAVRICAIARMREILEQSLASIEPTSVHQIAANLGYSNDAYILQKFPGLCREISRKIALAKHVRMQDMRQILENALYENPVPTLTDLSRRLGYSSSVVLRAHEPDLCDQLRAQYRAHAVKHRADIEREAAAALEETPVPSVTALCKRLNITKWFMHQYFPAVRQAIATHHRQWVSSETTRRRAKLFQDVRNIATSLQNQGLCPAANRIVDLLPSGSSREWKAINRAISATRKSLGISD